MNFEKLSHLELDIIGPLAQTSHLYRYLIVFTDKYSKWVIAFPARDNSVTTVVSIILEEVITTYGNILSITGNQSNEFLNYICTLFKNTIDVIKSEKNVMNQYFCYSILNLGSHWYLNWKIFLLKYKDTINLETGEKPIYLFLGKREIKPLPFTIYDGSELLIQPTNQESKIEETNKDYKQEQSFKKFKTKPSPLISNKIKSTVFDEKNEIDHESGNKINEKYYTLRGKQWLDDQVINDFGELITTESKFEFLSPLIFSLIMSTENSNDIIAKMKKYNIMTLSKEIIGVVNVDNNHWIAFHLIPQCCLYFYDPLISEEDIVENSSKFKKRFNLMHDFLKKIDPENNYKIYPETFILQKDSYNCGVYSCAYLESKSNGLSLLGFSADKYRKKIYQKLTGKEMDFFK